MRVTSQRRSGAGGQQRLGRKDPHGSGRRGGRPIGFWLGVAVLLHAEIVLLVGVGLYLYAPRNADLASHLAGAADQGAGIDVGMVDEEAAREIVADLEKQEEERQAEEARKEEESVHPPGQIVDLPAPREEHRPDASRFVSEHDSTVTHETKKYGRFEDHARQGDQDGSAPSSRQQTPKGDGRLAMRTPDLARFLRGAESTSAQPSHPGRVGTADGAPDPGRAEPEGAFSALGSDGRPRPGGGARGGQGLALSPTDQQLARAIGSGTQDALNNVDDGDETALNSKKWRFASFFNRVKRQVAEHWHPEESYRQRDPTGMIYGRKNRYTELRIQLKPDGKLGNVAVYQPSGLDFLDDEAIEAFKQAAPFPNPPRQLIEANGLINFGFGFLFDLNGPPEMRWFKY
jgi:TonB family protein